jgi:hypothetical protein
VSALGPLARAWAGLALLALLAAVLASPYQAALYAQAAHLRVLPRAGPAVLRELAQAVCVVWPLAWVGLWLGRPLGWGAPLLAGAGSGMAEPAGAGRPAAWRVLGLALCVGLALGLALEVVGEGFARALPDALRLSTATVAPPPWVGALGALAAGVNEEILLRLFLLTLLARLGTLLAPAAFGSGDRSLGGGTGRLAIAWGANAVAALVFGALHFSNVWLLGQPFTFPVLAFVLLANGGFGLVCGWLYMSRGIEAAIMAHGAADLVLHAIAPAVGRAL